MVNACCSQKSSLVTMIVLTTTFFFAEITVGYATNSMALVADSFHMLSDVLSLFVGFLAIKISQSKSRRKISKNTFGWVRAEVLGALVNSVFLVALCFSILVESLKRIVSPETISQAILVLGVGAAGLVVNILGIFIFQGHMGHGHSHGGHGHSHGGMAHGHKGQNAAGASIDTKHVQGPIHNGVDMQKGIKIVDKDGKQSTEEDTELRTIVIVNKVVAREDEIDVTNGERNKDVSDGEMLGGVAESRVCLTPSRYKMGIMLAALQANENVKEANTGAAINREEAQERSKKLKSSDQMNIRGVYLHILGDALGSVIVICSALAIHFGSGAWTLYVDPGMSILMVAIILKSSIPLLKESSMILLQTVPTHIQIEELEEKLLGQFPSIVGVHEFHIWQLAGSKIVASLHLKLPSRGDYMSISESLKSFFHDEGIHSTTIQPEFIEEVKPTDGEITKSNLCLLKCESSQCEESFCCTGSEEMKIKDIELQASKVPRELQSASTSAET